MVELESQIMRSPSLPLPRDRSTEDQRPSEPASSFSRRHVFDSSISGPRMVLRLRRGHLMTIIMTMVASAKVMKAGEFKAKCLELMDQVAESGDAIVITKRGKPVAQLVPAPSERSDLFGCLEGFVEITGDVVAPVDVDWGPTAPSIPRLVRRRRRAR
jgi:prevent-host-death family protein